MGSISAWFNKINPHKALVPDERRSRQGAWLLIVSLGIFFFSSWLLYVIYVYLRLRHPQALASRIEIPSGFVYSTVLLLAISGTLHQAWRLAKRDQPILLLWSLLLSLGLAGAFLVCQTLGMKWMFEQSAAFDTRTQAFALTLFLALVHALHVVGGVVALIWVLVNAFRRRYDHERAFGVEFCAFYWHFLDGVWILLLATFLVARWLLNAPVT